VLLASHAMQNARALGSADMAADADATLRSALMSVDVIVLPTVFDVYPNEISFAPDGARLAATDSDVIQIWNIRDKKLLLQEYGISSSSLAWSPDGRWLFTSESTALRDGKTGKRVHTALDDAGGTGAWHPKLPQFASSSSGELQVWQVKDPRDFTKIGSWKAHDSGIDHIAWSSDGTRIATMSGDTLRIWDASSHRRLVNVTLAQVGGVELEEIEDVSWSPDLNRMLTTGTVAPLYIRNTGTGKVVSKVGSATLNFAAWSHNGKWLAFDSLGASLNILDGEDYHTHFQIASPDSLIRVAWSADDRLLAVGTLNKSLRIYHTDALFAASSDDLLKLARTKVKRDLTPEECAKYLQVTPCPPRP
jgi:WD40 repeat protein